jgi:beta-lactamase regulating signal transducer with metallopeptidase domain
VDGVLNWIGQGCVVGLAAAGWLRVIEPSRARVRCWSLWAVLCLILLLPIVPSPWTPAIAAPAAVSSAIPQEAVVTIPGTWWTSSRIVIMLWAAWVAVFAWRIALAATALRRAKRECRPLQPQLEARLARWNAVRGTGRRTRLTQCDQVTSAAVLLGSAPVIAVAPHVLEQLNDDELDRIVVHEWAHVQRRDDIAHLLQLIVVACVGWHPAVWWCSRRLHVEREMACDEMAIALTGSSKAYAACLAKIALLPAASRPALPAVAAISASGVRRRITRALAFERADMGGARVLAAIASSLVLVATAFTVGGFRLVAAGPLAAVSPALESAAQPAAALERSASEPTPIADRERSTASAPSPAPPRDPRELRRPSRPHTLSASRETMTPAASPAGDDIVAVARHGGGDSLAARLLVPVSTAADLPGVPTPAAPLTENAAAASAAAAAAAAAPWDAAVDAGVTVGKGSQRAAVATAGFFNRLGRRIGGSF